MLKVFSENLMVELEEKSVLLEKREKQDELWLRDCFSDVDECLEQLSEFIAKHPFKDEEQKLFYYKVVRPRFLALKIFFQECYQLAQSRPVGTSEMLIRFYEKELEASRRPFEQYGYYWGYLRSGQTGLDRYYFIPDLKTRPVWIPEFAGLNLVDMTTYGYLFAKFQALSRLQDHLLLLIQLEKAPKPIPFDGASIAAGATMEVKKAMKEGFPIRINLSVDQLGLLLRASVQVGLISAKSYESLCKAIAPFASTIGKDSISAGSLRSNSYTADLHDMGTLLRYLRKVVQFIEEV